MKRIVLLSALFLASAVPAMSQGYAAGQQVEIFNPAGNKWETVTVTGVTGSGANAQYTIQGEGASSQTVSGAALRTPGAVSNAAPSTTPPSNSGVVRAPATSSGVPPVATPGSPPPGSAASQPLLSAPSGATPPPPPATP